MGDMEGNIQALDWLPVAAVRMDAEGGIVYANDHAQMCIGTSLQRIQGLPLTRFFAPETQLRNMLRRAANGETLSDHAIYSRRDHHPFTLHLGPDIRGSMAVLIPEKNRLEAEAYYRHQERTDTVARIALEMAHEVKNPLTSLRGAAQLLAEMLPAKQQEMARHILDDADRIRERIDAFLQLGPRANVRKSKVNIHQLLDEVCTGKADVQLRRIYDPALPEILLHARRMRQAIENLWHNALEAGSSEVEIQTRASSLIRLPEYRGMVLEIRFASNGTPVPPHLRDHLFEPYVTGKPRGSGLGLAIVQQVVHEHGGRVMFRADGVFSRFILHIPMQRETSCEP